MWQRARRWVISVLIVWHFAAMLVWLMPASYLRQAFVPCVRPYILVTSCWQQWSLFGPDPVHTDVHIEARITYDNGARKTWFFPRPGVSPSLSSDQSERFANFIAHANMIDTNIQKANGGLWPYMSSYAVRVCARPAPDAKAVHVELLRYYRTITQPIAIIAPFTYETIYVSDISDADHTLGPSTRPHADLDLNGAPVNTQAAP